MQGFFLFLAQLCFYNPDAIGVMPLQNILKSEVRRVAHSANFDENVHKPQSKS